MAKCSVCGKNIRVKCDNDNVTGVPEYDED